MEELKHINSSLGGTIDSLRYDSDTIAVYARELGYGTREERFIRIVGLPSSSKKRVSAGQLLLHSLYQAIPDKTLRLVSVFCSLLLFVFLVLCERRAKKRNSL
jgi:hypothetical protein